MYKIRQTLDLPFTQGDSKATITLINGTSKEVIIHSSFAFCLTDSDSYNSSVINDEVLLVISDLDKELTSYIPLRSIIEIKQKKTPEDVQKTIEDIMKRNRGGNR